HVPARAKRRGTREVEGVAATTSPYKQGRLVVRGQRVDAVLRRHYDVLTERGAHGAQTRASKSGRRRSGNRGTVLECEPRTLRGAVVLQVVEEDRTWRLARDDHVPGCIEDRLIEGAQVVDDDERALADLRCIRQLQARRYRPERDVNQRGREVRV